VTKVPKKIVLNVPVRIYDIGGWLDTWFAEHGSVHNLSVWCRPLGSNIDFTGIRITAKLQRRNIENGKIRLLTPDLEDPNKKERVFPEDYQNWDKGDLLETALSRIDIPKGTNIELEIVGGTGPGASLGTSAAVSVGLCGILEYVSRGEIDPKWLARFTHEIETKGMEIECGVQDQIASAYARGSSFINISSYPRVEVAFDQLADNTVKELETRLVTFIYGKPHQSSKVHKMVIEELQREGRLDDRLEQLRLLPAESRYCLTNGDLVGYGKVGKRNTECQRQLHPQLISPVCQRLIEIAGEMAALGWKVNGAGGPDGGSITILCGDRHPKEAIAEIAQEQGITDRVFEHRIALGGLRPKSRQDNI